MINGPFKLSANRSEACASARKSVGVVSGDRTHMVTTSITKHQKEATWIMCKTKQW